MTHAIVIPFGLFLIALRLDGPLPLQGDLPNTKTFRALVDGLSKSESPVVALDGYCPVVLKDKKQWQAGDVRFTAVHRGRMFYFASELEQARFLGAPDSYSPVLSGADPYLLLEHRNVVFGKREHGVFYNGRIVLFASEESLAAFSKEPQSYARRLKLVAPDIRLE